ncbi:flavin-binding monooxygenase [Colletotrichum tofieldiae]|nr:flavin-binding monooxygenase [Colletotrichum tofieldiae]
MEHYGQLMGLDIAFNTEVIKTRYDEITQKYRVEVRTPEGTRTISARHVVLATGVYGDQPKIPHFPGQESFKGQIYHSKYHKTAAEIPDVENKKVVVIGCATSGHDISADFVTHGAKEVTMVQRHPIYSISRESWSVLYFHCGTWKG